MKDRQDKLRAESRRVLSELVAKLRNKIRPVVDLDDHPGWVKYFEFVKPVVYSIYVLEIRDIILMHLF